MTADHPDLDLDVDELILRLERKQALFQQERAEATRQRYRARSEDGSVEAVVDGLGGLLDLTIDEAELRTSHPGQLGVKIVSAVHAARAEAGERATERMRQIAPEFIE
jgi:DNA-binding protein YbaB